MRTIAQLISLLALQLLRREWDELQDKLASLYIAHTAASGAAKPPLLAQQLLISGEDHRFFLHGGVDPIAVCRAIWRGAVLGRPEGASTIEMQIVRIATGRLERSLGRKLLEMGLATLVTRAIPKEALPSVYLQIGYFGWHMNGFEAACNRLGVNAATMSPEQTAGLVARLKYPQPSGARPGRWEQIGTRAQHLVQLHSQHSHDNTYRGLLAQSTYETI